MGWRVKAKFCNLLLVYADIKYNALLWFPQQHAKTVATAQANSNRRAPQSKRREISLRMAPACSAEVEQQCIFWRSDLGSSKLFSCTANLLCVASG